MSSEERKYRNRNEKERKNQEEQEPISIPSTMRHPPRRQSTLPQSPLDPVPPIEHPQLQSPKEQ